MTNTAMTVPCHIVDAFAERPFSGNPAAVCVLDDVADAGWMQAVAAEMNLSETAFVRRGGDAFELRWFTPTTEVDLCGHATLAAAHVLWSEGVAGDEAEIKFDTASGRLACTRADGRIDLDFPATPVTAAAAPDGLAEALGVSPGYSGSTQFDAFVVLDRPADLRALRPDFRKIAAMPVRGVIVSSASDDRRFDFLSRFFAPAVGVDEDPVTGSAHCALAPFWSGRFGRSELTGFQASRRGGIVGTRTAGDRVVLSGTAVTVVRGELCAPVRGASRSGAGPV